MKLLRPFTGTGGILFPVGLPPIGTCEFATKRCIVNCYANVGADLEYPDYDEEILIPDNDKILIYQYFMGCPVEWICEKIKEELDGLQTPILHWFGSGDCLTKDIDRITQIINAMDNNIVQMGFTRNVQLWERHKDILALTVENVKNIAGRDGMFSVPNYTNQISKMYFCGKPTRGGLCGPIICRDRTEKALEHYINCRTCRRLQTGCFNK